MKKTGLFFVFFVVSISIKIYSQNIYVFDDKFESSLIQLGFDSGSLYDYVSKVNINAITSLSIRRRDIYDLNGIEIFTALTYLDCNSNR